MTVREFLLHRTQVGELCVIRDSGYIVATAWIDCEDLFSISQRYVNEEIKQTSWKTLPVTTEHGDKVGTPCHYIDI